VYAGDVIENAVLAGNIVPVAFNSSTVIERVPSTESPGAGAPGSV